LTPASDFYPREILKRLSDAEVDFVVIGGLAAILHGGALPTLDLDIVYGRSRDNLERLAAVLRSLDVRLRGGEDLPLRVDARLLRNGDRFTFTSAFGDFDCMATADGAPSFDVLKARSVEQEVDTYRIQVARVDDLIDMKRAAGRAKDVPKLAELVELKRLVQESRQTED
jgi:hypothetical protein